MDAREPCQYCRYVPWDGECCAAVRLERERDEARADAAAATADEVKFRELWAEACNERDEARAAQGEPYWQTTAEERAKTIDLLAAALEAIIAEPWLSGGLDACTIASAALYPDAPLE